jgi:hypothetical protein
LSTIICYKASIVCKKTGSVLLDNCYIGKTSNIKKRESDHNSITKTRHAPLREPLIEYKEQFPHARIVLTPITKEMPKQIGSIIEAGLIHKLNSEYNKDRHPSLLNKYKNLPESEIEKWIIK